MGANPNTVTLQQIWSRQYQITHCIQPVYKAWATERGEKELQMGDTWHRTAMGDFFVNDLGGNGSYATQATVDTDETLVVNQKKEVSFQIPAWQKIQFHLPEIKDYGMKAMYRIWNKTDSQLLKNMSVNAALAVDDGTIGGTAGNGIVISPDNALAVYSAAMQQLQLANVQYVPNKQFTNNPLMNRAGGKMTVATISPQFYSAMSQFVAGKNSALGDKVTTNGYVGYFQGFNNFVSNNLLFELKLSLTVNPTDGDTFTLLKGVNVTQFGTTTAQDLTVRFKSVPAAAGDVVIATTAAKTVTNLVNALNAPYTTISNGADTGFVAFVQANLTFTQNFVLKNVAAAGLVTNTIAQMLFEGTSNFPVGTNFTSASNKFTAQIQHNLFGTSESIDLLMQKTPNIFENPVSGQVARDYVIWNLYGFKVFNDQALQLIDVRLDASAFTATQVPTLVTA